ncbi:signal peptidase I [Vagococcus sp. BWB3-3]|uniref:Signal peptidase I n=1 Tax=Vagococcus allomyrinae TaxID=2794353 RepID=A0A940PAW9_9ENTE|nr:signal peptidase I [Vagococcus allomyrinae]MBP1044240.1 signal peptidase I [Vagococcus allomyrinae]
MSHRRVTSSKKPHKKRQPNERIRPPTMGHRVGSLLWNVVFYVIFLSVLLGALLFNFNDSADKSFYGYRFMTVKTNSMAAHPDKPNLTDGFNAGDMIVLKQVKPDELKAKDIITFYPVAGNTDAFLTHRIIEIGTPVTDGEGKTVEGLTTQGDANDNADIPIQQSQVVGKVIGHVAYVGTFIQFVRDNLVVVLVLISSVFLVIATLKYYLSIPKEEGRDREFTRKKRKHPTSKRRKTN